ncbi:MAG TPA: glycosyltransferase [Polyangiaceae bacterium]|nr:glycosyltransferase [Polyangiaceae bacterium]
MRVVFASHTYLSPVFVVGSQQLARAAARAEHEVWHLSSAFSVFHLPFTLTNADYRARARLAYRQKRVVEPRLLESVPLTFMPWNLLRRTPRPDLLYLRGFRSIRRQARQLGFFEPDLLLIDEPRMAEVVPALKPKVAIYRPTDVYHQLKGEPVLCDVERRLLARVQGVVATSATVLAHAQSLRGDLPALLLENGVDLDHFVRARAEPEDLRALRRPRAVYVGALDRRFDRQLLHAAALANPALQFVVVGGPLENGDALPPGNVLYLGPRPYADIPAYLQHSDFAIMPLSADPANEGRSPMKIFEYGAAGLPVVASETAELRRRSLPFVSLAASAGEFATLCARQVQSTSEALRETARRAAAEHSWKLKAQRLFEFAAAL